jgi:dolichol-phosphate hexosyltransferase
VSSTGSASLAGSPAGSVAATRVERPSVTIILPTLNEFGNLPRTLASIPFEELAKRGWQVRPIVIDGGSTDGTLEEARGLGLPVLIQKSRGKGGAIREALTHCQQEGVRFAIVMDADCTYPGEATLSLISLLDSGCDLVVGVRQNYRKPRGAKEYVHRFGNAMLTYVASALGRELILDLCSGFWGVDLATWSDEGVRATGFEIESELFLKSLLSGFSVAQIPIPYRARATGAKLRTVNDGARILLSILSSMRFRRGLFPPARGPESSLLRSILAVCFIQGSGRLLVLTEAGRLDDAQRISQQLAAGGIQAEVEVVPGPGVAMPGTLVDSMVRRSHERQTPVVALTADDGPSKPSKASMVLLPNTQRVIGVGLDLAEVGAGRDRRMLAVDRSGATTQGFSILSQRPAHRPVGAFASLRAALDPSVQGTVKFLGANQMGLPLSVLRVGRSENLAPKSESGVGASKPK